jgi:polyisoprenoid-binding protein YceI
MKTSNFIISAFAFFLINACQQQDSAKGLVTDTTSLGKAELIRLVGKDYLIDDQHSYLGFKIKYFGFSPVRGRFNEFDGTVFYDSGNLQSLSVSMFIDVNSINTGNETRDEDLKREGSWFDAASYPYAFFQSKNIETTAADGFTLVGDLTIKGIKKEVRFEFEQPTRISRDWAKNEQVDFTGKATMNRQDFEVFGGDFWSSVMENGLTQLSDEVELELNIHCRRPDYQERFMDSDSSDIRRIVLSQIDKEGLTPSLLDGLSDNDKLSSGALSTIGYTLLEWDKLTDAREVFNKKLELYGASPTVYNQLGIVELKLSRLDSAKMMFKRSIQQDSVNSRAIEYQRLIENM